MFYNIFRISSVPSLVRSSLILRNCNKQLVFANIVSRRYSSKDSDCKDKNDAKQVSSKACKGSDGPNQLPCKPATSRTCLPSPPPRRIGPYECPPGGRMDNLPKPDCPWEKENATAQKKYKKHLIIGILVAAATLLVLWYNLDFTKEAPFDDNKKKRLYKRPKPICLIPSDPAQLPDHVPYLLIGGGTASFSAFRAIKSSDPTAKVLVISNECNNPYMRPPLSKEMWFNNTPKNVKNLIFKQWNGTERSLFYEPDDFYITPNQLMESENGGVSIARGYTVERLDVVDRKAILQNGREISYDKCLIATGSRPRTLDVFASATPDIQNKVTLYRDIFDYQELDEICSESKSVAIIGGGFLGSELACALGRLGKETGLKVYQVFREKGNMGKILPEYLSGWTMNKVKKENVNVIPEVEIEDVTRKESGELVLHLNNGKQVDTDHVILSVGVIPNTQLAQTSDLEVDPVLGGFLVNTEMEARSNLYVAGDCSCFYDTKLGRRRVEHHDHAVVSGRLAGENMAGAAKPYTHQSMFWSDLGPNIGYEAIGLVDSKLPTVAVFAKATDKDNPQSVVEATNDNLRSTTEETTENSAVAKLSAVDISQESNDTDGDKERKTRSKFDEYGKGIIFYLRDDIVVGIVLWNVFNRMSIARQVLREEKKYEDLNEVAKLFNIHDD